MTADEAAKGGGGSGAGDGADRADVPHSRWAINNSFTKSPDGDCDGVPYYETTATRASETTTRTMNAIWPMRPTELKSSSFMEDNRESRIAPDANSATKT